MQLDLTNKHAVVCGSTQGLGLASATALATAGARITLMARNERVLKEVVASLPDSHGQEHHYLCADFSEPENVQRLINDYISAAAPAHILVNNTGGPPAGLAIDARAADYIAAFQQHLICNQYLAQALVPGMKTAGYGRIINIISTSVKQPLQGLGVSNTIRGAVANWAKTLANELAQFGITVNNVLPGATETARLQAIIRSRAARANTSYAVAEGDMKSKIPAGRFGRPEEIASAVVFLASPAAAYINGINLPVDGGRTSSL